MKVSIITITFNRAHLIGETIQSVLNQTYPNFEHIIIDDGSTDDTEAVVKSFNDNRIKYFKYEKTGNLSKLHNYGLKHATGNSISILDSDDLWLEDKLEFVVSVFKNNPEVKFIIHNIQYFNATEGLAKNYYNYQNNFCKNVLDEVLLFTILPFPVFTLKREILTEVDYLDEFFTDGQQDFFIRVASKYNIYFISKSLTKIRQHKNNTHKNIKNIPYFTNYYFTLYRLLLNKKISLNLFIKGASLNSKNWIAEILKM